MPILFKTQVNRTAKMPIPARRARVGGLCGFQDTVERVPAESPKPGRCTDVRERCGNAKRRRRTPAGGFQQREKPQAARQDKAAGSCAPRGGHICPQCGQFWGFARAFQTQRKTAGRALQNEKSPPFQGKRRGSNKIYEVNTKMVKGKEKFALWITPECKQLVDDCYADDQCQSRGEYIEKAIWFYSGFLHAEKADRYLPKVLQQILSGTLDRFAERIGRQLFKLAVEQNVNNHILASDTDIDARSYQKMRGLSMDEVKRTNGRIDFEDALLSERGV